MYKVIIDGRITVFCESFAELQTLIAGVTGTPGSQPKAEQPTKAAPKEQKKVKSPKDVVLELTLAEDGKTVGFGKLPYRCYVVAKTLAQAVDDKVVYDSAKKSFVFKTKKAAATYVKACNGHVVTAEEQAKAVVKKSK